MKRIFLILLGLGLAAAIGQLGWNLWQTTRYFEENGREATVVIGKRYNAERWMSPLPIKKIYTYTAKLEPKYEVLIESDQDLKDGEKRSIRFLTRDLATGLTDYSIRPISNGLRLRGAEDGTPVKLEDSALFDNLVDKWMGPPAKGVYVRPRAVAEAAPNAAKPTVPFVFAGAGDSTWGIIWNNSRVQEWLLLGIGLLCVQSLLIAAWDRHKEAGATQKRGKGFVHPSLRRIEADSTAASKKLTYVPRPDEEIVLSDAEKRRLSPAAAPATSDADAPASVPTGPSVPQPVPTQTVPRATLPMPTPATSSSNPTPSAPPAPSETNKTPEEPLSFVDRETAPPMPIPRDVVLKLRRKQSGENPAPEPDKGGSEPAA